jgi:hypothetical protein
MNAVTAELKGTRIPPTTRPEVIQRLKRDQFSALNSTLLARALFRQPRRRRQKAAGRNGGGPRRDFGSVEPLAVRVHGVGERHGRRHGLGAADLRAAATAA